MQVHALMKRVKDEVPEADLRNFLSLVQEGVRHIWGQHDWREALATYDFSPHVQGTNGTVTNGSATIGHSGSDLFLDAHVGATVEVVAGDVSTTKQVFTLAGVTDANTATLSSAWSLASQVGDVTITVKQLAWPLPATVRRLWYLWQGTTGSEVPWQNPRDYRVLGASGADVLQLRTLPTLGAALHLEHWRGVTVATGPASETGLGADLEELLWWYVLRRVYGRMSRVNPEAYDGSRRDAEKRFHVELGQLKTKDARYNNKHRMNRRTLFSGTRAELRR